MDLALNNLQKLICHKTQTNRGWYPVKQNSNSDLSITSVTPSDWLITSRPSSKPLFHHFDQMQNSFFLWENILPFQIIFILWIFSFVGTTEKIFESKTHLFDVYINNQNVTTNSPVLKELLKVSDADRDKFTKLNNQRLLLHFLFLSFYTLTNMHKFCRIFIENERE